MKIRITQYLPGTLDGHPLLPGEEFEVADHVGQEYIERGLAEPVKEHKRPVESASVEPPETTSVAVQRGRPQAKR